MYCNVCNKYRKLKKNILYKNTLNVSIGYSKFGHGYEKYLKKKNQLKY